MGFFNLYKPREYKYRYIYYDPKKEAQKERDKEMAERDEAAAKGEYRPTIKRGTFREMANKNRNERLEEAKKANIRLLVIVLLLMAFAYYLLT